MPRFPNPRACLCAALIAALAGAIRAIGASADTPSGAPVDGVRCDSMEGSTFHIHQHLALFDHGKPVLIPSDVGRPLSGTCLYWIHTHTPDGIVHIESPAVRDFTLGQFFDVWGEPLRATAAGPAHIRRGELRAWLGGQPYHGDPRAIGLTQHADITLEAGPPYHKPAPFTDWQNN